MFGTVRSGGWPVLAQLNSQCGRTSASGAKRTIVLKSSWSGMLGLPQSRLWENDQSSVRIKPAAPAALARSIRCTSCSFEPHQYIWKNVWRLAATTSSTGLLANELSPIAVPRAAAARATATSPSG
jgi:hypothetical protein